MDYLIEITATVADKNGDYSPCGDNDPGVEFGVYLRDRDTGIAIHTLSFPTRSQADAFALGLGANPLDLLVGNTEALPEDDPVSTDLSAYHAQEVATQAAQFMSTVEMARYDGDKCNGMAGLYEMCADAALAFNQFHWDAQVGIEDYWDIHDWYETSDEWFAEHLAPSIYFTRPKTAA